MRWVIGVDEAGRGPLAGPVAVGAVMVPEDFDVLRTFPAVKDSKQLSPQKRSEIYKEVIVRAETGDIRFCVRFSNSKHIDIFGITKAVSRAVAGSVRFLAPDYNEEHLPSPKNVRILLDGLLRAPSEYEQETIIHGDALVPLISLASVVAKVRRDALMKRFASRFPEYGFEKHKGYRTSMHSAAIREFGLCTLHRSTFCKNLLIGKKTV